MTTRYRVIDTLAKDNEHLLSDSVPRAVGEEYIYVLESADE